MSRVETASPSTFTEPSHSHSRTSSQHTATATAAGGSSSDPTTKLAEAIDDFLGDLEKRFKGISDEILTRLDDMAERCDRLEQEMLLRDASALEDVGSGKGQDG